MPFLDAQDLLISGAELAMGMGGEEILDNSSLTTSQGVIEY
jgi:hypothetical protein